MDTIFQHRTIRKYKSDPISDEILEKILSAASRASTTGNMQVYSIIVTRNEELKKQLWEAHFKQNMVLEAPVLLTFCADFNRFNKWCRLRKAEPGYDNFLSFFTAAIDALLAAQNAALEAEYHGLGICYLGTTTYMAKRIIEILQIPKGVVPVTTLVIGYPNENPPLTDRLPLRAIVHNETYNDFSEEEINQIYYDKENMPFYQELVKLNNTETLAQIFTEKRYTKKDNIAFSKALLDVLYQQGFMNNE
ncbi:MAG: nitroreductase family protein [Bacteroidales bacterium]|nr:nitroreductase family protein [Bacteroidales bacterium]